MIISPYVFSSHGGGIYVLHRKDISIIIPTLNAEKTICRLINEINKQTLMPIEIIVLDSSSCDRTVLMASSLGCTVINIERCNFDHGGTRDLGAKQASGSILVFMTQDALPYDNTLFENLLEPLANKDIAASFARQVAAPDSNPLEKFSRLFNYPTESQVKTREDIPRLGIKAFFFSNVCSAIKKDEYLKVGGFPKHIIMNEDMIMAARLLLADYKIIYNAKARVWHSHNYSISLYFKRYFDIGAVLNMNSWMLDYARIEGEGARFIKDQLRFLVNNHYWHWIPYSFMLSLAKYAGFKLGLIQNKLPANFKKQLSLNKIFWMKGVC
jgi:rhamnosyltransferase